MLVLDMLLDELLHQARRGFLGQVLVLVLKGDPEGVVAHNVERDGRAHDVQDHLGGNHAEHLGVEPMCFGDLQQQGVAGRHPAHLVEEEVLRQLGGGLHAQALALEGLFPTHHGPGLVDARGRQGVKDRAPRSQEEEREDEPPAAQHAPGKLCVAADLVDQVAQSFLGHEQLSPLVAFTVPGGTLYTYNNGRSQQNLPLSSNRTFLDLGIYLI